VCLSADSIRKLKLRVPFNLVGRSRADLVQVRQTINAKGTALDSANVGDHLLAICIRLVAELAVVLAEVIKEGILVNGLRKAVIDVAAALGSSGSGCRASSCALLGVGLAEISGDGFTIRADLSLERVRVRADAQPVSRVAKWVQLGLPDDTVRQLNVLVISSAKRWSS
jgi:hypothetical protein